MTANEVPIGSLFLDGDGDLFIKACDGAVLLGDQLTVYSKDEMMEFSEDAFFEKCTIIPGKIEIEIIT